MESVCVFCGSSMGRNSRYRDAAEGLGRKIAGQGLTLVYGGGDIGLMGIVAETVLQAGGRVIGVIPQALVDREVAHHGVTELRIVNTMHERKAMMAELADAFVALPGGMGTFEELCEILTWAQLGIHRKPIGLLNVAGYWQPFVNLLDHAVEEGFLKPAHRELLLVDTDASSLLDSCRTQRPVSTPKWLTAEET
jgi:uncharacterized protein (TIGR00730 family)